MSANMSHVVVKFSRNWADEFDMEGARLFTKEEWDSYVEAVQSLHTIDVCFGTNEGWEGESPVDWLRSFTSTNVSDEDAEAFKRMFPLNFYKVHEVGYFPSVPKPSNDEDWY
jgi:hypothetical protein